MELAIAKSVNIAPPGICKKIALPPHSCVPIWGDRIRVGVDRSASF